MKIDAAKLADHIRKNGFVSTETDKGVVESAALSSEVTKEFLPEGITVDTLKTVSDFQKATVGALTDATGTVALERFKESKELQGVQVSMDMFGGNKAFANSSRQTEVNVGKPGGEPKMETRYNNLVSGFTTKVGKKSSALKAIMSQHNEAGKKELG